MKPIRKAQDKSSPTICTCFTNEDPELHNNLKGLVLPGHATIPGHCSRNVAGNGNHTQQSNWGREPGSPSTMGSRLPHEPWWPAAFSVRQNSQRSGALTLKPGRAAKILALSLTSSVTLGNWLHFLSLNASSLKVVTSYHQWGAL